MKPVHFIGIGGTGLSAIARILLESGYPVSGSDRVYSPLAEAIDQAGAQIFVGHAAENVTGADIVIRSSAIPDDNVEVRAALSQGIPVLKRADYMGQLLADYQSIAVAGTHGKTSTTALIAWMLTQLGQDPSYIVGGIIRGLRTNAHAGQGLPFVIEADEYDRMFLGLHPAISIVTNVEHDHPDCYPTPDEFHQAFRDFVGCLVPDGLLLACGDDPGTAELVVLAKENGRRACTYGVSNLTSDYTAKNLIAVPGSGYQFDVFHGNQCLVPVALQVPGQHNVQNALAAFAVAHQMDLPLVEIAAALGSFRGTGRRFEVVGETRGVTVISDYAHHPTEIRATLAAAQARYPSREIWAVWQPHTYSRTKLLFAEFAASFEAAHHVVVTEVYPSREPVDPNFSSQEIVARMDHPSAHFGDDLTTTTALLLKNLKASDVLIVLTAGDADQICTQILMGL
jgi:UDP-N-acetylmuramate--alanine ligase